MLPKLLPELTDLRPNLFESTTQVFGFAGERGGNRTHDPLIKSQMLYLLSYALAVTAPVGVGVLQPPRKRVNGD